VPLISEGQLPISHTHYGDAAISTATIKAKTRYGNSAHMGDNCRQKLCI